MAHPDAPARAVEAVEVEVDAPRDGFVMLSYRMRPAEALLLPDHAPGRTDGLWKTTCFELFVQTLDGPAYREFNFAPVGAWAAYAFTGWREGMMALDLAAIPTLDDRRNSGVYELDVVLAVGDLGSGRAGLSAVIEETDGTRSFWALRHPPGKPDFHHPDCFALEVAAVADR